MAAEVKRATENLTCPICCQLFKNPKYLLCHHYYCEGCLERMQKQSRITCPECRQETEVPAGGVKELPNNFLINRLLDDFVLKRREDQIVTCDECTNCNDGALTAYCPNCNLFLCGSCYDNHKQTKACHDINTISLSSSTVSLGRTVSSGSQSSEFVCKEHDYELNHYCDTCDKLVCLYCTTKQHSKHDHDTVKDKIAGHRDEMKRLTSPLEGMVKNLLEAHDNIDNWKAKIQEQDEEINAKIDQNYEKLFRMLMAQKEQLKKELSVAVAQVGKAAATQQEEISNVLERLLKVKELNQSIEEASDQQALSTKPQLVGDMEELGSVFKKQNLQIPESPMITYTCIDDELLLGFGQLSVYGKPFSLRDVTNSKIENIPKHIFEGRKVELKIISKDQHGCKCPIGGCQVAAQLESNAGEVTVAPVKDNNDGSYTASFVVDQVGETKLTVSINGQQLKESPWHFTVLKDYLALHKATKTLGNDGNIKLGNPWGIAFSESGMCAVTDNSNHCVYIFNCKNQLVRKFGKAGYSKGQFQSPRGIAFDNTNHLYVADYKNDRVQKFSIDGQYLLQLDTFALSLASMLYKMNFPTGIATFDNRVYVTEKARKGYVSVFLSSGRFCSTIGSKELSDPCDVTVRADGQLFVADCVKNCIFVYTLDGIFQRKFATGGTGRGQLNSPFSLATDADLFIFVADTWNHRVVIFDKDGNHVHCFGSEGSASDRLKRPHGIAFNPDGKIYLTDYGNSRIQIF